MKGSGASRTAGGSGSVDRALELDTSEGQRRPRSALRVPLSGVLRGRCRADRCGARARHHDLAPRRSRRRLGPSASAGGQAPPGRVEEENGHRGEDGFPLRPPPPQCSTSSRARDRRKATRLRRLSHPEGLPGAATAVKVANVIAAHTLQLAEFAAELGALVTTENPDSS